MKEIVMFVKEDHEWMVSTVNELIQWLGNTPIKEIDRTMPRYMTKLLNLQSVLNNDDYNSGLGVVRDNKWGG